ncbi:hypothetical protein VPH35_086720 [Triticum aestivum]
MYYCHAPIVWVIYLGYAHTYNIAMFPLFITEHCCQIDVFVALYIGVIDCHLFSRTICQTDFPLLHVLVLQTAICFVHLSNSFGLHSHDIDIHVPLSYFSYHLPTSII